MAWKRGPLPPDTWHWGGVVAVEHDGAGGFFFADFKGDHAVAVGAGKDGADRILKPEEVAWYDNGLTLPPTKQAGDE